MWYTSQFQQLLDPRDTIDYALYAIAYIAFLYSAYRWYVSVVYFQAPMFRPLIVMQHFAIGGAPGARITVKIIVYYITSVIALICGVAWNSHLALVLWAVLFVGGTALCIRYCVVPAAVVFGTDESPDWQLPRRMMAGVFPGKIIEVRALNDRDYVERGEEGAPKVGLRAFQRVYGYLGDWLALIEATVQYAAVVVVDTRVTSEQLKWICTYIEGIGCSHPEIIGKTIFVGDEQTALRVANVGAFGFMPDGSSSRILNEEQAVWLVAFVGRYVRWPSTASSLRELIDRS